MSVDLFLFSSFARQSVRLLSGGSLFSIVAGGLFCRRCISLFFFYCLLPFGAFVARLRLVLFSFPLPVFLICEEAASCFV